MARNEYLSVSQPPPQPILNPRFLMINQTEQRVFVIDDHPLMRAGITQVIENEEDLTVCGDLGAGRGTVDLLLQMQPDAVLLDLSLEDCSGMELIKDYRAAQLESPILVISSHDETLYAERVLKAGANGYLMKKENTDCLINGIRTVLEGDIYLSEKMNRLMLKRMAGQRDKNDRHSVSKLTDRELEVFELIGNGIRSCKIAKTLGISPKTVDAHRANIKEKLGLTDGAELVRFAVRWVESGS